MFKNISYISVYNICELEYFIKLKLNHKNYYIDILSFKNVLKVWGTSLDRI